MGNRHQPKQASSEQCGMICNCFIKDKNVKSADVLRNCKVKWLWTPDHQVALETVLRTQSSHMPTVIISSISGYTSSSNDNYNTLKEKTFTEKRYHNHRYLLQKKKLCVAYFSQPAMKHTINLILIATKPEERRMVEIFKYRYSLPALNVQHTADRTVNLDGLSIRVNLVCSEANHRNIAELHKKFANYIYIIESNEGRNYERVVSRIRSVNRSLNDCIFFGTHEVDAVQYLISNKYNIPYVQTRRSNDEECCKDINDLFTFAIKYYWFSKVYHPSIVL